MTIVRRALAALGMTTSTADERYWWDRFTWAATQINGPSQAHQQIGRRLMEELERTALSHTDRTLAAGVLHAEPSDRNDDLQ